MFTVAHTLKQHVFDVERRGFARLLACVRVFAGVSLTTTTTTRTSPHPPPPPVHQTHPFHMRRHRHGINNESRCWGCSLDINRAGRDIQVGFRGSVRWRKKKSRGINQRSSSSVHHIIYVLCSPTSVGLQISHHSSEWF